MPHGKGEGKVPGLRLASHHCSKRWTGPGRPSSWLLLQVEIQFSSLLCPRPPRLPGVGGVEMPTGCRGAKPVFGLTILSGWFVPPGKLQAGE